MGVRSLERFLETGTDMVFYIGASCLDNIRKHSTFSLRQVLSDRKSAFAVRGLSINPATTNKLKDLNYLIRRGSIGFKRDIILWHDVISNSVSKHKSNNNTACSSSQLINLIEQFKDKIAAIIYLQREGAPNLFHLLKNTKILTIDARNLLSYRKKNNKLILHQLKQVHPQVDLESHLFNIVHEHRDNLRKLIQRKRSKKNKKGSRQRRRQKLSEEKLDESE